MPESFRQRIIRRICRLIGCRKGKAWEYAGQLHTVCGRCGHINSKPIQSNEEN